MTSIIAVVHVTAALTAAVLASICLLSAIAMQAECDLTLVSESPQPDVHGSAAASGADQGASFHATAAVGLE